MKRFDYLTTDVKLTVLQVKLRELGAIGWKLICSFVSPFDNAKAICIFEKEL